MGGAGAASVAGFGGSEDSGGSGGNEEGVPDGGVDAGPDGGGLGGSSVDGGAPKCAPNEPSCVNIAPALAAAPCAGIPYSHAVSAVGGQGPFTWEIEPPSGEFELRFEEGDQERRDVRIVSSHPNGPRAGALFRLRVTDTSQPYAEREIEVDLTLRDSCWFAYTPEASPSLALVAPHTVGSTAPVVKVLPPVDELAGGRVVDFKFSPDGARLAIRLRAPDETHRLTVFAAPDWLTAVALPPSGSVTAYAWSPNASILAVASTSEGTSRLSGARFDNLGAQPVVFPPATVRIGSELFWVGNERVVFHANDEFGSPRLGFARATETGLQEFRDEPVQDIPYTFMRLLPGRDGLFLLEPGGSLGWDFLEINGDLWRKTVHFAEGMIVSPDRARTAAAEFGQLTVRDAVATNEFGESFPLPETAACDFIMAWSPDGERVLCSRPGLNTPGTIALLPISEAGAGVGFDMLDLPGVPTAIHGHRRSFAPERNWVAFVVPPDQDPQSNRQLHIASVSTASVEQRLLPTSLDFIGQGDVDLVWSPDAEWLWVQVGSNVLLQSLNTGVPPENLQGVSVAAPGTCSEVFTDPFWCGSEAGRNIQWSPDSAFSALLTVQRSLQLVHTARVPAPQSLPGACTAPCNFGFQPTPNR